MKDVLQIFSFAVLTRISRVNFTRVVPPYTITGPPDGTGIFQKQREFHRSWHKRYGGTCEHGNSSV